MKKYEVIPQNKYRSELILQHRYRKIATRLRGARSPRPAVNELLLYIEEDREWTEKQIAGLYNRSNFLATLLFGFILTVVILAIGITVWILSTGVLTAN